jgi:hypothetical protein
LRDIRASNHLLLYGALANLATLDLRLCCYDLDLDLLRGRHRCRRAVPLPGLPLHRDHRSDRPQVMVGLLTTTDGLPIAHHVFPGNRADVSTLPGVVAEPLPALCRRRLTLVADRGARRALRELGRVRKSPPRSSRDSSHNALACRFVRRAAGPPPPRHELSTQGEKRSHVGVPEPHRRLPRPATDRCAVRASAAGRRRGALPPQDRGRLWRRRATRPSAHELRDDVHPFRASQTLPDRVRRAHPRPIPSRTSHPVRSEGPPLPGRSTWLAEGPEAVAEAVNPGGSDQPTPQAPSQVRPERVDGRRSQRRRRGCRRRRSAARVTPRRVRRPDASRAAPRSWPVRVVFQVLFQIAVQIAFQVDPS